MLEIQKKVLAGVSYSKALFSKELRKSLNWLAPDEIKKLKIWVQDNFMKMYSDVILEVFYPKVKFATLPK